MFSTIGNAVSSFGTYLVGGGADQGDVYGERRPGGPKGPKRKPTQLEMKHWEWTDRRNRRANQLANLQAENEQLTSTIASWNEALTDTNQKRNTVKQDLDASKQASFAGEEEVKLDTIKQLIEGMNQGISTVGTEFRKQFRGMGLPVDIIAEIGEKSPYANVQKFIHILHKHEKKGLRAGFIIGPIVQHIIADRLVRDVFQPFWPGSEPVLDKFFSKMRENIEEKDGLDRANRWRSLTTTYLDPTPKEYAIEVARNIISDIKGIYNHEQMTDKLTPTPEIEEAILSLVEHAMDIQRMAKVGCIEGDVTIYVVNGADPYDTVLMRACDISRKPRYEPSFCLISVGVGMNTHKVVTEPDGSLRFIRLIYKPADSLCMDCVIFD